ncbi:MAG TPA: VOC family protein [Acidimicrobiales bacterium]
MQPIGLAVAIAVPDLDEAVATYQRLLGGAEPERASSPADGVEVATFRIGDGHLQLVAPTRDDSVIAQHLADGGPALHHFGLLVGDMGAATGHLAAVGARTLGEPRPGAGGRPVLFLHPKAAHGALIELLELKEG